MLAGERAGAKLELRSERYGIDRVADRANLTTPRRTRPLEAPSSPKTVKHPGSPVCPPVPSIRGTMLHKSLPFNRGGFCNASDILGLGHREKGLSHAPPDRRTKDVHGPNARNAVLRPDEPRLGRRRLRHRTDEQPAKELGDHD